MPVGPQLRLRPETGFEALFYRQFIDRPFEITLERNPPCTVVARIQADRSLLLEFSGSGKHRLRFGSNAHVPQLEFVRFYSYSSSEAWQYLTETHVVRPPDGKNLLYVARHNAKVYDFLKETVGGLNWKLRFDPNLKTFRLSEIRDEEILDYNLDLLSDSLKRLFFYGAIVLSSTNAVLVLDEPDVFAFPPYPKMLGEMIAADESNQYFISTHNPYFLTSVVSKVSTDQLGLFVCHRDSEGATSAKILSADQVSQVIEMGASVFFNLDDLLGHEP